MNYGVGYIIATKYRMKKLKTLYMVSELNKSGRQFNIINS